MLFRSRYRRGGTEGAGGDHIELIASSMRQYVHMALVSEAMAMEPAGEGVEPGNGSVAAAAGRQIPKPLKPTPTARRSS